MRTPSWRWATAAVVVAVVVAGAAGCGHTSRGSGGWLGSLGRTRPTAEPTNTDPAVTISPNPQTVGQFGPKELQVTPGTRVQWNNWSQTRHTVTFDDPSLPSSPAFGGGGTWLVRFPAPGTFSYHCSIHAVMTARVVVA